MEMKFGQMILTAEWVTSTQAEAWLEKNVCNRRIRNKVVAQYARDQKANQWYEKPVAICFDTDGNLGNGQHTLSAIVQSGVPQQLLIARNVSKDAISAMDRGVARTISDVAKFLGFDVSRREIAVARTLEYGVKDESHRSFDELWSAYMKHEDAIRWIEDRAPKRVVGMNAAVLSVVARAWYSQDKARLDEFMTVMVSGVSNGPPDSAAIRLREICRQLSKGSSTVLRIEMYRKTQAALDGFLKGQPMTKVYGIERELFPLPGERSSQMSMSSRRPQLASDLRSSLKAH